MATTFAGVLALITFSLLRPTFNGWELLLLLVRPLLLAGFYLWIRRHRKLTLGASDVTGDTRFGHLSLKQLFALTSGVAVFFSIERMLDTAPPSVYGVLLLVFTVIFGLAGAFIPLIAFMATLAKRHDAKTAFISLLVIIVLATTIAGFVYSQTDSWITARQWLFMALIEALVVGTSILGLRFL